jgi:hypothetical protein
MRRIIRRDTHSIQGCCIGVKGESLVLDGDVVRSFPDAALRFDDPVVLALLRNPKGAEVEHVSCLVQELGETSFEIAVGVLWVAPKRASSTSASGVRQRGIVGVLGRDEPDLRGPGASPDRQELPSWPARVKVPRRGRFQLRIPGRPGYARSLQRRREALPA